MQNLYFGHTVCRRWTERFFRLRVPLNTNSVMDLLGLADFFGWLGFQGEEADSLGEEIQAIRDAVALLKPLVDPLVLEV